MKTQSLLTAAVVTTVALHAPGAHAWWDNGHMLAAEIATQLMASDDVKTMHKLFDKWSDEFPNTKTITTTAVWPDMLKCKSTTTVCQSPLAPSLSVMEDWHYIDLPLHVNGSDWKGQAPSLALFADALDGNVVKVLEGFVTSLNTTKSVWAANFAVRNMIHFIGDIHMPLHAVGGISNDNPKGDAGGNFYKFASPCEFSNLHAMWDSGAGLYTTNWAPKMENPFKDALKKNATELKNAIPLVADSVPLDAYKSLAYKDFAAKVLSDKLIKKMVLESYRIAQNNVYHGLNLTYSPSKTVACPSAEYKTQAQTAAKARITLAGKRLAVFLTQIAKQLRELGLPK